MNAAGWQSAAETISNVCSTKPSLAVPHLPQLMKALQQGVKEANSDQVIIKFFFYQVIIKFFLSSFFFYQVIIKFFR